MHKHLSNDISLGDYADIVQKFELFLYKLNIGFHLKPISCYSFSLKHSGDRAASTHRSNKPESISG